MEKEEGTLEGALVPAPKPAEMRYEDEDPDAVTRVLVRVDYADGRIREYEAREPQQFRISDPESMATMSFRRTGLSVAAGGGFAGVTAGVPTLSLSFAAHPRHNMHIRTERTAEPLPGQVTPAR
jgi:hypothetical protein